MKKMKAAIYTIIIIFILYTLYKVVLIYILNVSSLKSSYIYHSKSIEISKSKGLYVATYQFDKMSSSYILMDTLIPKDIYIEREKVIYPQYYFYWGKSEFGNRTTTDGSVFLGLSKSGKYYISCPSSTLPNEKENIDRYRKDIYFFFETVPSEIIFTIYSGEFKSKADTLVFKKK